MKELFDSRYNDCLGSFSTLHQNFPPDNKKDAKTVLTKYKPAFDSDWKRWGRRLEVIDGKAALASIRRFFKDKYGIRLSTPFLIDRLIQLRRENGLRRFVEDIYQVGGKS